MPGCVSCVEIQLFKKNTAMYNRGINYRRSLLNLKIRSKNNKNKLNYETKKLQPIINTLIKLKSTSHMKRALFS